jgi:hypothetical protein
MLREAGLRACHTSIDRTRPSENHFQLWTKRHGTCAREGAAAATANSCTLCHQPNACTTCHQTVMPEDHNNFWRLKAHGIASGLDRSRCQPAMRPTSARAAIWSRRRSRTRPAGTPLATPTARAAICRSRAAGAARSATRTRRPRLAPPSRLAHADHGLQVLPRDVAQAPRQRRQLQRLPPLIERENSPRRGKNSASLRSRLTDPAAACRLRCFRHEISNQTPGPEPSGLDPRDRPVVLACGERRGPRLLDNALYRDCTARARRVPEYVKAFRYCNCRPRLRGEHPAEPAGAAAGARALSPGSTCTCTCSAQSCPRGCCTEDRDARREGGRDAFRPASARLAPRCPRGREGARSAVFRSLRCGEDNSATRTRPTIRGISGIRSTLISHAS